MIAGVASATATDRYRQRFPSAHPHHFRRLQDLQVSSIGLGTYLGDSDDATDARYAEAIRTALRAGCNLFDAAINYRCQRSERVIGAVLASLETGGPSRDELVVCTKGGYLPFDGAVPADPSRYFIETLITPGILNPEDVAAGCHCISPSYIDHALATSLANLRLETIDVYYLHNPEQQLDEIGREEFNKRLEAAFALLERRAGEGRLRYYGVATWNGLRVAPASRNYLSLDTLVGLARKAGGASHRFAAIQLPYNLAMPEAYAFKNQTVDGSEPVSVFEAAQQLGLSVAVSASLLQSRLATLPGTLSERITGLATSAQRALQFARSGPGVATALVGMKDARHAEENLGLAAHPSMSAEDLTRLFDRSRR
jgi:aryl-alcohol dehydrogenase-like predicted oxidoreductase